jgi:hypothetical protein
MCPYILPQLQSLFDFFDFCIVQENYFTEYESKLVLGTTPAVVFVSEFTVAQAVQIPLY